MDCQKDPAAGIRNAEDDEKEGGVNVIDATVDRMFEAAVAEEWERQNKTDPELCPEWDNAIKEFETALDWMAEVADKLDEVAEMVGLSCEADRIRSLEDEVRFLYKDFNKQIERMKNG